MEKELCEICRASGKCQWQEGETKRKREERKRTLTLERREDIQTERARDFFRYQNLFNCPNLRNRKTPPIPDK